MKRLMPVWVLLVCGVLALGCEDDVICDGGACVDLAVCEENCLEICDGAVFSAFCTIEGFCECGCEFGCL